ncbi:cytochrome b [Parashewanella curva]|nr:cytochrome b [Parashewanella curva]
MNYKLSKLTIFMHWIVGFGMIGMLLLGWYMTTFEAHSLYPLHKSVGLLVICFSCMRILWRLKEGWFPPATPMEGYEKLASKTVHYALLIITLLFPISGMLMSAASGHGIAFFGHVLVSSNIDSATHKAIAINHSLAEIGKEIHRFLMWALAMIFLIHISAVIKHHFFSKDDTLNRMLGK